MTKKEIKIGNIKLPYQNEAIVTTQSGNEYSILILNNNYLGEFLVKKLHEKNKEYNYLLGIGSMKVLKPGTLLGAILKEVNSPNKEIIFFKNKISVNNNTLDLKSFIGGAIFYDKISNSNEFRYLRKVRNTLLQSNKNDSFSRSFMNSLSNSSKIVEIRLVI